MKSIALLTTITMAHVALCVPVPWMAGDKILPLLNKDAPSSGTPRQDPKTDKTYVLASSHLAPGPVFQKAESSFSSSWDNWKKKHGAGPIPNLDKPKKNVPVLIITEMGELGVGIPSSSSSSSSKQASSPKQKALSVPPPSNEKAENVSVTEMGELSIGITSPVPSPQPPSSLSSSSSWLPTSSRPSNGTTPCPFYVVGKPCDHDDVLVIFLVSTFLLVVVVVEAWGAVCRSVRNRFASKRQGAIRLVEETETKSKLFRSDEVLVKSSESD
ncbi:hypothetical protein QBC32DRAFT_131950 [Pseudoneurospora amorphoporcata]|uniref:Uncharacterized protein n=1 Tax=Pseudoneurospora amorphoporcata TaxID=241081 RepID=A0AAN6NXI0_9PEZI|nr:hypothetical protein QBC32DRAFT_131950 [Pseudoneurospora amorphoporcata]